MAVTVVMSVTVVTDVTNLLIARQKVEPMMRQARFPLPQNLFDDMHHACIDLARRRGVKRITLVALLQEACELFLDFHGLRRSHEENAQEQGA